MANASAKIMRTVMIKRVGIHLKLHSQSKSSRRLSRSIVLFSILYAGGGSSDTGIKKSSFVVEGC